MSDQTVRGGAVKRPCSTCGYWDNLSHCSNCGAPLDFYGQPRNTSIGNLVMHLAEVLLEFALPALSLFKTFWLLTFKPVDFFRALFKFERPIHDLKFPLGFVWRMLERGGFHRVFNPIRFYILSATIALLVIFGGGQFLDAEETLAGFSAEQAAIVWSPIFTGLLAAAVASLCFEIILGKEKALANNFFSFWVYMYGSMGVVILPVLLSIVYQQDASWFYLVFLLGPFYYALWVPYRVFRRIYDMDRIRLVFGIVSANIAALLAAALSFTIVLYAIMTPLMLFEMAVKNFLGSP